MIYNATEDQLKELQNCFEKNINLCLYSYINFMSYGLQSKDLTIFFNKQDNIIDFIITKYIDCCHLYSIFDNWNVCDVANIINKLSPNCIRGEKEDILKLFPYLQTKYKVEHGYLLSMKHINKYKLNKNIIIANENDINEIAEFVFFNQHLMGSSCINQMATQFKNRYDDKTGRHYIIRSKEKVIISHAATFAEQENLAIISAVLTKNEYFRKGYATKILYKLCHDLLQEGKIPYLFCFTESLLKFYINLGFILETEWSKLTKL